MSCVVKFVILYEKIIDHWDLDGMFVKVAGSSYIKIDGLYFIFLKTQTNCCHQKGKFKQH